MSRNFVLTNGFVALVAMTFAAPTAVAQNGMGYDTVEEAREALLAKPGATTKEEHGWLIVSEPSKYTLWSFTPSTHEAHPAVVKRATVEKEGGDVWINMQVICQASKPACDRLVESFEALNKAIGKDLGVKP